MKILIVEDDPILSDTIVESTKLLYEAVQAFDGEEGLYLAEQNIYDIIILDVMLPNMNGYEILRELRAKEIRTPVIFLTAKDGIDDKIQGLRLGADDYLVKPFHREELLLRLEAIVRRTIGEFKENSVAFKDLKLNLKTKSAMIGQAQLKLNGKQFDLLEYLMNNKETILTKEQIFDRVWGFQSDTTNTVVEVYTSHIRKKLKPFNYDQYVKTFRGLGYMLTEESHEYE
ncbi:response regulator transcription factor [Rossellomorea aquimaris]|uniref:response regulator transcription factor n=1 Tax=Rossellomorea aquimaris TaxID=189382 RepID=UPI001CD2921C|nr:response regulator transcription factor [Rossellomorea aquimaris]MCA1057619.1 response regulator transcription factor [Rossellomorea aquimaris]